MTRWRSKMKGERHIRVKHNWGAAEIDQPSELILRY